MEGTGQLGNVGDWMIIGGGTVAGTTGVLAGCLSLVHPIAQGICAVGVAGGVIYTVTNHRELIKESIGIPKSSKELFASKGIRADRNSVSKSAGSKKQSGSVSGHVRSRYDIGSGR